MMFLSKSFVFGEFVSKCKMDLASAESVFSVYPIFPLSLQMLAIPKKTIGYL